MNVGANSKITDCLVANPIRFLGKSGLLKFRAVWIATTPPTKNDMKETIPIDPIINESISLMIRPFITLHLVNLPKTLLIIIK
jgi:hypothetical protein